MWLFLLLILEPLFIEYAKEKKNLFSYTESSRRNESRMWLFFCNLLILFVISLSALYYNNAVKLVYWHGKFCMEVLKCHPGYPNKEGGAWPAWQQDAIYCWNVYKRFVNFNISSAFKLLNNVATHYWQKDNSNVCAQSATWSTACFRRWLDGLTCLFSRGIHRIVKSLGREKTSKVI